jgi:hypothetical protein
MDADDDRVLAALFASREGCGPGAAQTAVSVARPMDSGKAKVLRKV